MQIYFKLFLHFETVEQDILLRVGVQQGKARCLPLILKGKRKESEPEFYLGFFFFFFPHLAGEEFVVSNIFPLWFLGECN